MADVADQAAERREFMEREALTYRKDTTGRPQPVGGCHACGEEVTGERIFCDAFCARVWDQKQERGNRR